ncbi:MAG: PCRF domain-containing protein, partial [Planctomycetota bacterium]
MIEQKDSVLAKLDEIEQRYDEIDKQIADPEIASDPARLIPLSKEQGKLRSMVVKYREYKQAASGIEEAEQILADSEADEDFKALAQDEMQQLEAKSNTLLEEIINSFVMADDMDIDSVIVEIRAGTGGEEAALFARDLYTMYIRYAESHRWKVEQLDFSTSEMGGFREVIFGVKGPGVWADLGYEGGGHRVQRVPETESQGRVHTSAATVAVLPEPEELDIEISSEDVVEHVSRSGGPGGQSVNKLNSAIKLEHVPT